MVSSTYVGHPAPSSNISAKNINTIPNSAPKPQPNSIEKPNVPQRGALPNIPTRAPLPTPILPSKQPVDTKPSNPAKPALPSKPPPSLKSPTIKSDIKSDTVSVSLDPTAATNIAKTAYTSGAAKTLIQGSKPTFGANGVLINVDPEAAKKSAIMMHSSGMSGEFGKGLRVNTPPPSIPSLASKPKRVPKYTAVRAFGGDQDGDLPLKIGDLVLVLEEVDANWFRGESCGLTGIFPKNFVVAELE
jgi:hypothetical protein